MLRAFGPGLLSLVVLLVWIYCVVDVVSTDDALVRNLPKVLWLVFVVLVPLVGSVAWLAAGRPRFAGVRPGDTSVRPVRRARGPEDLPGFAASSGPSIDADRLQRWEDDLARRERELGRGEDEPGAV
jgi:hypothetical protein